jgi:hypothetical protein
MTGVSLTTSVPKVKVVNTPTTLAQGPAQPSVGITGGDIAITVGAGAAQPPVALKTQSVSVGLETRVVNVEITGARGPRGEQGLTGEGDTPTFESVSKNIKAYPFTYEQQDEYTAVLVYDLGAGQTITKTINSVDGLPVSIVLSGNTPSGIDLTKTILYNSGVFAGASYA